MRDGFDVYLYDQIGSGHSARLANPWEYTVDRHVADLEAIRQRIGAEQVVLHLPEAPQLHPAVGQDHSTMPHTPGVIRQFVHFFWSIIAHPWVSFDALATARTMRWALVAAGLPVLQVWGHVALFSAFGFDWLGTKPILTDPTFVANFGHWRVTRAEFVPVFVALMPLLALWSLLLTTGTALLLSKLWGG